MTGLIAPEEMTSEPAAQPLTRSETPSPEEATPSIAADDLAAVRELIVRTHADVVPELIGGATIGALLASIAPAQEAFARIAAQTAPSQPGAPAVPAGGTSPAPVDPARLSAAEKIRRGLATS